MTNEDIARVWVAYEHRVVKGYLDFMRQSISEPIDQVLRLNMVNYVTSYLDQACKLINVPLGMAVTYKIKSDDENNPHSLPGRERVVLGFYLVMRGTCDGVETARYFSRSLPRDANTYEPTSWVSPDQDPKGLRPLAELPTGSPIGLIVTASQFM